MDENVKEYGTWAAGLLAGVTTLVVFLRKTYKAWEVDGRDIARVQAETDVVGLLRSEILRVFEQNAALALEIVKLHNIVLDLRTENSKLTLSVSQLTEQLGKMRRVEQRGLLSDVDPG